MGLLMSKFKKEELMLWFKENQPQMVLEEITPQTELKGTVYLSPRIEAKGFYSIMVGNDRYGYELSIVISVDPDEFFIPTVFCIDKKLYPSLTRHILADRQACLGTFLDIVTTIGTDFDFSVFSARVLNPFVAWQLYYETFGKPPPWGERAHGALGIIQSIADRLSIQWNTSSNIILHLLLGPKPKKRKRCFCGSKKQFRYCHGFQINKIRRTIIMANDFLKEKRLDKSDYINSMLSKTALEVIFDDSNPQKS